MGTSLAIPWFDERVRKLEGVYDAFQSRALPFVAGAACRPGCADCCTNVGEIYTTTLEGLRIRLALQAMSVFEARVLRQRIAENKEEKKRSLLLPCPFLDPEKHCRIYAVRPFTCRRLYSIEPCGQKGPVVHRDLWALAEEFTRAVQALDPLGYSGHVSYILSLFDDPSFTESYMAQKPFPKALERLVRDYDLLIHAQAI